MKTSVRGTSLVSGSKVNGELESIVVSSVGWGRESALQDNTCILSRDMLLAIPVSRVEYDYIFRICTQFWGYAQFFGNS